VVRAELPLLLGTDDRYYVHGPAKHRMIIVINLFFDKM
jgi:hypothetical protein